MKEISSLSILRELNRLYKIGPKRPAPAADIIRRFRALSPGRRNVIFKALRASPELPQFEATGILQKAATGDTPARPIVECVLSTSEIDRDGDRMSEKALGQMQKGFAGLTIFLAKRRCLRSRPGSPPSGGL
jgi:hypothetical protein